MDWIELVSVTAGSAILLALIGSVALEGIKGRKEKTIAAIDSGWNRLKVPIR